MAVDIVHEAAGMSAVQIGCDIQRWRDVHTITQHAGRYEAVGRVMLGLDSGLPII